MKKTLLYLISASILLTACGTSYNVETELTTEETNQLTAKIEMYEQIIKDFESGDKESYLNYYKENNPAASAEEIDTRTKEVELQEKPPSELFVAKYRAEQDLGDIDASLETLEDGLEYYENSLVLLHNSGKAYDRLKECEKSEEYYQKLATELRRTEYHYDIAKCYMSTDQNGDNYDKVYTNYKEFLQTNPDSKSSEMDQYIKQYK